MTPAGWAVVVAGVLLAGCGEIERLDLTVRPRQDDFEAQVQPLLQQLGCSRNGRCHTVALADLQIHEDPTPAQLQENFQSVKARLDLENPEASDLVSILVQGAEKRHPPPPQFCFVSTDSCAYRKIVAWIAWQGPSDPRPQDIDCDPSGEVCQ